MEKSTKALNCLYGLSELISQNDQAGDELLRRAVNLIPLAFQHPEAICARIRVSGKTHETKHFVKTDQVIEQEIVSFGSPTGKLVVCCLANEGPPHRIPFLREERLLVSEIAERLGKTLERTRAQMDLQKSEKLFRTLVENSLTGICIVQGKEVAFQNKEQERLFGPIPRSAIMGDLENIHPDDLSKVKQFRKKIANKEIESMDVDFRLLSDNGQTVWINCRANRVIFQKQSSILFNMMDMTQSKELEKLLIVQDKMASLGRVAAGIAHEIRNPLSGINIYLNALEKFIERGESEEQIKNVFFKLTSASRKIESVIRRVMDFSKPNQPNFISVHMNEPIQEALKLTATTLRKSGIALDARLADNLATCRIDPQQMEEVVVNMIANASDAMRDVSGEKRIKVVSEADGGHVVIRIIDSGNGISVEDKEKLFDPFFTTKSDSTGIGLSICHRIVSDHHGKIEVHESQWGGTEFTIRIPVENPERRRS